MRFGYVLNCVLYANFVVELYFVLRFVQYECSVNTNVLSVLEHGHILTAPVLQKSRLTRRLHLGGRIRIHICLVKVLFTILMVQKIVRIELILTIINRIAIYFTLYGLYGQYKSCDNDLM